MAVFDPTSNEALSAALGAVIGGAFAVLGVYLAYRSQRKARQQDDKEAGLNFLAAIREELKANLDLYAATVRRALLITPDGDAFLHTWPIGESPFPVYAANCGSIGLVQDASLRSDIVRIYVLAMGLVSTYRFNNILIERFEHFDFLSRTNQSPEVMSQAQRLHMQLAEYAPGLRERDAIVFAAGQQLIQRIEGVLNSATSARI